MAFRTFLLLVIALLAFLAGIRAQSPCYNCAQVVRCGDGECLQLGSVQRPIVATAPKGDYCWEYCWGKVNQECKKDFYSTIYGAWRCPDGQVCRYLKRGAWKCFDLEVTLKEGELCWNTDWPEDKKMDMRNKYCPEGTTCSMEGIWNSGRKDFFCKKVPQAPACFAVPGSNYVRFDYWPQTYQTTDGQPCGGVYPPCKCS